MNKQVVDFIYLLGCGVHRVAPEAELLSQMELGVLLQLGRMHSLEALVGTVLKEAGVPLPAEWQEDMAKAVRKAVLFDAEFKKLAAYFEQTGIWYLPLKGMILKGLYPYLGSRQMADMDILFDADYAADVRKFMTGQGYKTVMFGRGNHDVYEKAPVYNFELHTRLYGSVHREGWTEYYKNVKERLIQDGTGYAYRFTDEDFYVYIISHEYKHYSGGGSGLRSLLDVYLYLEKKAGTMDFDYITEQCRVLGVDEFEQTGRRLAQKLFSRESLCRSAKEWKTVLCDAEEKMLRYCIGSGVYGTEEQWMEKEVEAFREKSGTQSKLVYYIRRMCPPMSIYKESHPFFYKNRWLAPLFWVGRACCVACSKRRRQNAINTIKVLRKIK